MFDIYCLVNKQLKKTERNVKELTIYSRDYLLVIFIQKYFFFLLDLSTDHNIFKYLPNFFLISN